MTVNLENLKLNRGDIIVFRYNWRDYVSGRFWFKGKKYKLVVKPTQKLRSSAELFFILNVHRGRWVSVPDLLDFLYSEDNPESWSEWQVGSLRLMIAWLRRKLPEGVSIVNRWGGGYKLQIDEECYAV